MKVVHVITRLGRDCGGPVRSVQGLVAALESVGVETWLLSMKTDAKPWLEGVRHYRLANAKRYGEYKRAMAQLIEEVKPDLVHLHNVWNPDIHAAAVVCRKKGVPYISAPRGSLEPWSLEQKKFKKKLAMWLYQRKDLKQAIALHSTAEEESAQFRKLGFSNTIVTIPNGVNVPSALPDWKQHQDGFRRFVFVSRIHKKKGLEELVEAWRLVRPVGWKLEIVGFDEDGSLARALKLSEEGGFRNDVIYTGPLEDNEKWNAYRRGDVFVLPTHSENFGIVVAEALYAGLPVITTKGCPWKELESRKCGWWVDRDVEALANALRAAVALTDDERMAMGGRGRELVEEKYCWSSIGKQMVSAYESLLKSAD